MQHIIDLEDDNPSISDVKSSFVENSKIQQLDKCDNEEKEKREFYQIINT